MSGPDHWITMALLAAIVGAGLIVSGLLQHELQALTAAVADHEAKLLRIERAGRRLPVGPWLWRHRQQDV
jgi:hypothetical protein